MNRPDRILVVEDSPTQAEGLRQLLESSGYQVQVAGDGQAALAIAKERRPAVVITDVLMPGMDGYELCTAIKSDDDLHAIPVILLTSLAEPQDVVRSLQCGADNFIRKPYEERYLLSRISNMLTSRELRRDGKVSVGVEVYLAGERHFITAERQQILDFLLSTYEEISHVNEELAANNSELAAERERAQNLANVNRAVLDATADAIALVDEHGTKLLWNTALARIADSLPGLRPDAPLVENAGALASHAADRDGYLAFIDSLRGDVEEKSQYDLDLPRLHRSFRLLTAPVRDENDLLLGRLVVLRETTAERQAEQLKTELVATVSHELRTPLTGILGFAELLQRSQLDEPTRRYYLETIHDEARRLTDLVNDFLDLQRIEAGEFSPTLQPLDLRELLTEMVQRFSSHSPRHSLVLETADTQLLVCGERERLEQVLANLLSNAIKYSPEGGRVEVSASRSAGSVQVAIRDEGIGIPADQQASVFDKFFRADSSDTRRIGGTGLGLAICREIIASHGGEIGFDSVEGEGSTFWFRLPGPPSDTA